MGTDTEVDTEKEIGHRECVGGTHSLCPKRDVGGHSVRPPVGDHPLCPTNENENNTTADKTPKRAKPTPENNKQPTPEPYPAKQTTNSIRKSLELFGNNINKGQTRQNTTRTKIQPTTKTTQVKLKQPTLEIKNNKLQTTITRNWVLEKKQEQERKLQPEKTTTQQDTTKQEAQQPDLNKTRNNTNIQQEAKENKTTEYKLQVNLKQPTL